MAYGKCPFKLGSGDGTREDCVGGACQLWIGGSTDASKPKEGKCSIKVLALSVSEITELVRVNMQQKK